jgi:amino acid adenylation domain-containing protein
MGKELLESCQIFRDSIKMCEHTLESLPEPPAWSLHQELIRSKEESRISEAMISQPLCTAVQIALVDLLRASGIHFSAVVGHSSGEIGAAYAAGILNLSDAISIAYYRGYVTNLAEGPVGGKGGMIAVAMSFRNATAFCSEPRFAGRVNVAASNAPSSVTLSGDLDAIKEIKVHLEGKQIQGRELKVDTAYHSHHMLRCSEQYLKYLKKLDIQLQRPTKSSCTWMSSVYHSTDMMQRNLHELGLDGSYWVENMVQPVLFSEAVEYAVKKTNVPFGLALEVGPHPALKGPVSQILKSLSVEFLPYAGCLDRNISSAENMSAAIGLIWSYLGNSAVDFDGWRKAFGMAAHYSMMKDLPSYPWDHEHVYWRESRISYNYRLANNPTNSLLGRMREDLPTEKTWRNILKLSEIPWVRGHTFQGQVLFPAAGYITLATEASKMFAQGRLLKLLDIRDVEIPKPLIIGEDQGVELLFSIKSRVTPVSVPDGSILETEFVATSCADERNPVQTCTGRLFIHLGVPELGYLPTNPISQAELTPLSTERFHRAVSEMGLGYTGSFRALTTMTRSWGHAKATASWAEKELQIGCALHPAIMDVGFQAGLATFVSTAERAMGSPYLPVGIKRVILDPNQNYDSIPGATTIEVEALMAESNRSTVNVDINFCINTAIGNGGFQVDGLILKAIAEPEPSADRNLFVKTVWDVDTTYEMTTPSVADLSHRVSTDMSDIYERITLYYMQNLIREVSPKELESAKWHHRELARYINTTVAAIREGGCSTLPKEWLKDNQEIIGEMQRLHSHDIDVVMLTAVGKNLPSVVRGQSEMMEHMLQDDLLSRLYKESEGLKACNKYVADIMRQISHKHPNMNILEIGAGTGGTTLSVLDTLDSAYYSYVCTDISASFFSGLGDKLPVKHKPKVEFKVLNAESPPSEQGFTGGTYDVVIAANVLHATRKLSETVKNARRLLRPGGYLIAVEVTGKMLRETGLMGALEGWWLGAAEGRANGPGIGAREWDNLLQENGFSGIECIAYDHPDVSRHSCSVFAAQAADDRFDVLRDPLAFTDLIPESPILIVGGKTLQICKLVQQANKMLRRWSSQITICGSVEELEPNLILPETFILYLSDLDKPFFSEPLTTQRLENLQEMLGAAKNILWVTRGRLLDDPHANMMVGVGRALSVELPHVNIHYLDFDQLEPLKVEPIVCQALRMAFTLSSESNTQDLLWAQEPEIVMRKGQIMIPRILQDHAANETLNATRRQVKRAIGPDERIEIYHDATAAGTILTKGGDLEVIINHVEIEVDMSLALHVDDEAPCFVLFGHLQGSAASVYALSEIDASTVAVHENAVFQPPTSNITDTKTLLGVASSLIASCALSSVTGRGTTLVFGASQNIEEGILNVATRKRLKVLFINVTTTQKIERPGWLNLHPHAAHRCVKSSIPQDASTLLSFSNDGLGIILESLPKNCTFQTFDPVTIYQRPIMNALEEAYYLHDASAASFKDSLDGHIIRIQEVIQTLPVSRARLSAVLDWRREGLVDAVVPPLEARNFFSSTKTYFLVGMAGELGQSLCRFMVRGGARYIVLGSRNPTKDPHWLQPLRANGADIRIVKVDVTDLPQLQETVALIRRTMPEIGGVANAALVFEAGIFANFSAEDVTKQLRPKVDGSLNMDEVFKNDNLEFFLTFGSLATVCGNPGQAMYHAGNLFMASLMEQRRRRGQAASILNFGLLVDVGYVARKDRDDGSDIEGTLRSLLLTPLSEAEFHQVVLRGIISGRPGPQTGEVVMGMEPYIDDGNMKARPPWVDKAFFSHMIRKPVASDSASSVPSVSSSMQHLREELESVESLPEAIKAVQKMFYKKIEMMIMVPKSSVDLQSPMVDLGLDSLHAIEIRNWLLKDMHIEFPLLRILGSEPLSAIYTSVAESYMNARKNGNQDAVSAVQSGSQSLAIKPHLPPAFRMQQAQISEEGQLLSPQTSNSGSQLPSEDEPPSLDSDSITESSISVASVRKSDADIQLPDLEKARFLLKYSRTQRLSYAQLGIHFLHTFLDDPTNFNVTTQYTIRGHLNPRRLARAIEKVLGHHEIYQTAFSIDAGDPEVKQQVASNVELNRLTQVSSTKEEAEHDIRLAFEKVANSTYRLDVAESFRAVLISHGQDLHTVVFGFHLISSDAFSFSIFLRDIDLAYQMLPLSPNPGSFLTFAKHQYEDVVTGKLERAIQYWKDQLSPLPADLPLLPFAHGKSRQPRRVYRNHITANELDPDLVAKVKTLSQKCGATSMQFYLTVFQALLANLTQSEDICIGVTDNGRGQSGQYADAVGHFANILPMRFHTRRDVSFGELLKGTSNTVLRAFDNARVPFDVLLERLGIGRSSSSTPLFQVAFNYRVGDILRRPLGNCVMTMQKYTDVKTPYDLTINITQTGTGSQSVECITADSLYSFEDTENILGIFSSIVESVTQDPSSRVEECKMFNPAQVEKAIELGRGPNVDYEWPKTLPERFNEVVAAFPDSVAIKDAHESLTYNELSRRVMFYISTLLVRGLESGSCVAVMCEPGVDMYAMMLANLFIGAVHVPLDTSLPAARLQAMITACKPDLIVFHDAKSQATGQCCGELEISMLNLGKVPGLSQGHSAPGFVHIPATEGSFILFTSGSTGTPKGICLGQHGIMNYAASKRSALGLGQLKILQQTSTGFDMAIAQAFNAFANGGTLVVTPLQSRGDPSMISQIMLDEEIEFTLATPSEYLMLANFAADTLRKCTSWRHACSGGEAITEGLVHNLRRLDLPNLILTDCYGPTEISCAATFQSIPLDDDLPSSIGRSIPNTAIYILNESDSTPLPPKIPGEICIGGIGVSQGYLDPALNVNKFVTNPFATPEYMSKGWYMMYKTGDRGILQPDGSLKFLGRTDGGGMVIKLRGLRIDLTEVSEAILAADPGGVLAGAAVTVRGDPQYLVCHVVTANGRNPEQAVLDDILRQVELPRYMIPSFIVPLEQLPSTPNGKVDRRALQKLPLPYSPADGEKRGWNLTVPQGELRAIWIDVLGEAAMSSSIGPDSDFFMVGGSSLLLVHLQNAIRERIGVSLSLQELYQSATLRRMANAMHKERGQLSDDKIDWDVETAIPTWVYEAARQFSPSTVPSQKRQVILTGSTTFLGGEILRQLIENVRVSKVHCISVLDGERKKLPSEDKGKLVIYAGSVLSPNLGLSKDEIIFLQSNVDQIIHATVQGHCMNNYTTVKQALYASTQSLIGLIALPRKIPFHLISAPRVTLLSGKTEGRPVSMRDHQPPSDGSQGVTASKWASERFLQNVNQELDLPVVIHRHCALIGERAPADDVMNSVVRFSLLTHKVPNIPETEGFFDFKDVVEVASEIAGGPLAVPGPVRFQHHSSNVRVPFGQFAQRLREMHGGEFEAVDPVEWLKASAEVGMQELLVIHLQANMASGQPMLLPYLGT